jgi:hypothetical protein
MHIESFEKADCVREGSGVTRRGAELLIVTDADPGAYYSRAVDSDAGPLLELQPERLRRIPLGGGRDGNGLAMDLEGIAVLADGRVVALSERLRSLVDARGLVIQYDDPFSELGDRGLEGLAVRPSVNGTSEIAVLWEGGRIEDEDLQPQIRGLINKEGQRTAFRPVLLVHRLEANARNLKLKVDDQDLVELDLPVPDADAAGWRFRAPDLVWHEEGFIVLLNSQAVAKRPGKPKYGPRCLQRFDCGGKAIGGSLDLETEAACLLHGDQRLKNANWEGLGWYDTQRLVLVQDIKGDEIPTALLVDVPKEWRS